MTKIGIILVTSMFLFGLCWSEKSTNTSTKKVQRYFNCTEEVDDNPGTAWNIRKNYILRYPHEREFGPSTGTGF